MASVKLNINRTTVLSVPIEVIGEDGNAVMATFQAECKILKRDSGKPGSEKRDDKLLIEEVLVKVSGLDLTDGEKALSESETRTAVIADTQLSALIVQAWYMGNENVLTKSRTYAEQLKA